MSMKGTLLADYDFAMTGFENKLALKNFALSIKGALPGGFSRNFWRKESLT